MIESEWLEVVKKVRGNWSGFCVEKQQFDTFYDALKEFDVKHIQEAADRIVKEYGYPPIVATFTVYIEQVQEDEQHKVNRQLAEKKELEDAKRKPGPANDHGWFRFTRWMLQEKKRWPKEGTEIEAMKVKFEKEHPGWQPRKQKQAKRGGMAPLGQSLGDAMGNLR